LLVVLCLVFFRFVNTCLSSGYMAATIILFCIRYHQFRGLRCPTEPTTKLITSWWLVCSNSDENLDRMEEMTKRLMLSHVKAALDTRRRCSADPPEWIEALPDAPLQLLQQYPATFAIAFGSSAQAGPIPSPMDLTKVLAFDQTYGCRGGARSVPVEVRPSRVLARQPSEQGPAERMANVFMSRMENIFSSMMNNGANNGGPGMGRGLSALANTSDLTRRMPTIGFGQPEQLALLGPAPILQVLPPALSPDSLQPSPAVLAESAGSLQPSPAVLAESAGSDLEGMLDMLAARDGSKKAAAKAANAAAKAAKAAPAAPAAPPAAAPAGALVAAEAAAEPAAMAKAEAKVKAPAAKVKAAAAKAPAAAAAAKAAPAAKVKAAAAKAPPAAAAAKAAPAAKVKAAGAKAPPAPPAAAGKAKAKAVAVKLGCPKCRSAFIKINQDVPKLFSKCSPNVPQLFPKCVLQMLPKCSPNVSKCSPNVPQMFPKCSPNVLQMFPKCSPNVPK
jgi:hypothetical protein